MFWFNGGPGCSSFDGLMMELGPWRVDGEGGLKTVDGGWEEYTTMVYIDQPAGTGLSYTSTNHYVKSLSEASEHVIQFMRTFYKVFPEYATVDTYLGGESYAGQYIPYFADAILKSDINMPLRGAAIGNGWIDARRQYPAYLDYAVAHNLIDVQSEIYKNAANIQDKCQDEFRKWSGPEPIHFNDCEALTNAVLKSGTRDVDGVEMCTNIYDVRLEDEYPYCGTKWPPDLADVTKYLDRKDVVDALHASAKSESWVECLGRIGSNLNEAADPSSITLLPSVIERIPVLLFAGDKDFVCNYMGIESMIQGMSWNGETGLGKGSTKTWSVNNQPAGTWVTSRNLTYAKVFNASHMVPYDVPDVAHDMILRFMGVDFSRILDGSARIPSAIGDEIKPSFDTVPNSSSGATPNDEAKKALWDEYYNTGSTVLVLLLIAIAVGGCIWFRLRRRPVQLYTNPAEESIPLTTSRTDGFDDEPSNRKRKGKERATTEEEEPIFDVGDDDDERSDDGRKSR